MIFVLVSMPALATDGLENEKILAEQGDSTAQFNLGWMYHHGEGVPQDYTEAARW